MSRGSALFLLGSAPLHNEQCFDKTGTPLVQNCDESVPFCCVFCAPLCDLSIQSQSLLLRTSVEKGDGNDSQQRDESVVLLRSEKTCAYLHNESTRVL